MDTFRPSAAGRQAYMQRMLKAQQPNQGPVFGAGKIIRETGGMGADILRHVLLVVGVGGLVAIAVGATTKAPMYHAVLNWITSWFV